MEASRGGSGTSPADESEAAPAEAAESAPANAHRKPVDLRDPAKNMVALFLAGLGSALGSAFTAFFQSDRILMLIVTALFLIVAFVLYFAGEIGRSLRARFRLPARSARFLIVVSVLTATAAPFLAGYWVIGNGFAHGTLPGLGCLLAVTVAASAAASWYRRPGRRPAWLRSGRSSALVITAAALGLSAGATLGSADLSPAAAATAQCPAPAELRVLVSAEILGAVRDAITAFEQNEPAYLHQACYAVDLTAYAAPTDAAADAGVARGWQLGADGPRPDVWIPSSSAELTGVTGVAATAGGSGARLDSLGSIGSSPVVIAVPSALAGPLSGSEYNRSWAGLYDALSAHGIGLAVPNPRLSETALLGITGLYQRLTQAQEHAIEASGSFPPDSDSLLCAAAQSAQQPRDGARMAYLVAAIAMTASNDNKLTAGACATMTGTPAPLTAFYPAGGPVLDFPFAIASWDGNSPAQRVRARYELDFYRWLSSQAGNAVLSARGVQPPAQPNPPPDTASTLNAFNRAQAPARILVAIDDSRPMQPYLQPIAAEVNAVLGPGAAASHLGARDSFGVWEFPGPGSSTYASLVRFSPAAQARPAVSRGVSAITSHGHSAQFNMLTQAALFFKTRQKTGPGETNSVVILTDGDGYYPTDPSGDDPGGDSGSFADVTSPVGPLRSVSPGIRVFIIAFGPPGCTQAASGDPGQSLTALATSTGGNCWNAADSDLGQLLSQVIGQLSAGG